MARTLRKLFTRPSKEEDAPLTTYQATILLQGKIITSFNVEAKHEHAAWTLASLKYLNEYAQADQAYIDIAIVEAEEEMVD